MSFTPTMFSLELVRKISQNIPTFHHHYHILFDIASSFESIKKVRYLEIGCYGGASAALVASRPNTHVISVDVGRPIPMEYAVESVNAHKHNSSTFKYILGNSCDPQTMYDVHIANDSHQFDVLFIDGDHSRQAVITDYLLYSPLLGCGGFLIFDDYRDAESSPQVRMAVDELISRYHDCWEIFGTIPNVFNAHPQGHAGLAEGNCFVVRKK